MVVTATGLALAFMVAGLVYVLATARTRAATRVTAATADLAAAEAAARDQADLLAAILDSIGDGVGVVDHNGEPIQQILRSEVILGIEEATGGIEHWQAHYGIFGADGSTPFPTDQLPLVRALAGESTEQVEMVIRNASHPDGITITVSRAAAADRVRAARGGGRLPRHHRAQGGEGATRRRSRRAAGGPRRRGRPEGVPRPGARHDRHRRRLVRQHRDDRAGQPRGHPAFRSAGEPVDVARALSTMDVRYPDGRPVPLGESPLLRALDGEHIEALEVVIAQPDGTHHTVVIHAHPLLDAAGDTIGAVATSYDITVLREREAELHAFAGVVAHDLKAPLTAVDGYAEILDEDLADGAPVAAMRGSLDRMRAGVQRMRRLIDDLLAYATARDAELHREPVDLQALIAEIVTERTAHLRGAADTPFPDIYTGPLPVVHADRVMVRQLLDNLVGNALKYTPPGQPARIDIAAHQRTGDSSTVRIQIADRGIGIPADDSRTCSTRSTARRPTRATAARGLGLAICHRVVDRHGGTIGVSDNPGGGTRVTFTLPVAVGEDLSPDLGLLSVPGHRREFKIG